MKKGDFIVIMSVLLIAVTFAVVFFVSGTAGKTVVISQNNRVVCEAALNTDKTVDLGTNTVSIEGGRVKVTQADCKNQICVNHKSISKKGESIVCLPNKVIVEIK